MSAPVSTASHSSLSGAILGAAAFALLTSVDTIFKLIAVRGIPVHEILLVNACFALMPIFVWALMTGGVKRFYTLRLGQQLARGCVGVLTGFAAVYAYSRIPLANFYAIVFAGPLIVTALSAFWLGEKVELSRWIAIAIGFCGILIVTSPQTMPEPEQIGSGIGRFAAFISVFCYALSVVMIRRMRQGESNLSFSFYGYVAAITICGLIYLTHGGVALAVDDVLHLALSGMLAGISSICLMTAYHRSPVAIVAPFQYTQIIWGAVFGYVLFDNVPGMHVFLGAIVVAASGLFVIMREFKAKESS